MRFLILALLLLVGCDYMAIHEPPAGDTPGALGGCTEPGANPGRAVTYQQVVSEVFEAYCFSCHGNGAAAAGISLSSYSSAKAFAGQIKFAVVSGSMPKAPNPALSQQQKDLVAAWVDAGAPDTAGGNGGQACVGDGTTPPPAGPNPPIDEPLTEVPPDSEINYTLVRDKIFKFRCFACHSTAGGNADGLNLETYFNTVDELEDIEEEVAQLRMPPPPRPALNPIERTTILKWIELGAPRSEGE